MTVPGSRAVSNQIARQPSWFTRCWQQASWRRGPWGPWTMTEHGSDGSLTAGRDVAFVSDKCTTGSFCHVMFDVLKLRCLTTMPGSYSQYMLHIDSIWIMLINHDRPMVCRNRKMMKHVVYVSTCLCHSPAQDLPELPVELPEEAPEALDMKVLWCSVLFYGMDMIAIDSHLLKMFLICFGNICGNRICICCMIRMVVCLILFELFRIVTNPCGNIFMNSESVSVSPWSGILMRPDLEICGFMLCTCKIQQRTSYIKLIHVTSRNLATKTAVLVAGLSDVR